MGKGPGGTQTQMMERTVVCVSAPKSHRAQVRVFCLLRCIYSPHSLNPELGQEWEDMLFSSCFHCRAPERCTKNMKVRVGISDNVNSGESFKGYGRLYFPFFFLFKILFLSNLYPM